VFKEAQSFFSLDGVCPIPPSRMGVKERFVMTNAQMELGLGKVRTCPSTNRRQRRLSRANWWFQQMREVVDKAVNRQPAQPTRPEHVHFPE
jgi:hypothetical protein